MPAGERASHGGSPGGAAGRHTPHPPRTGACGQGPADGARPRPGPAPASVRSHGGQPPGGQWGPGTVRTCRPCSGPRVPGTGAPSSRGHLLMLACRPRGGECGGGAEGAGGRGWGLAEPSPPGFARSFRSGGPWTPTWPPLVPRGREAPLPEPTRSMHTGPGPPRLCPLRLPRGSWGLQCRHGSSGVKGWSGVPRIQVIP